VGRATSTTKKNLSHYHMELPRAATDISIDVIL